MTRKAFTRPEYLKVMRYKKMNIMNNLLQIIDLNFAYQSEALFSDLNLLINRDDKIGLIGHNGCGKSTLLALINGKHSIDSGEIRKPRHLKIATVEQFIPNDLKTLTLADALLADYSNEQKPGELWRAQRLLQSLGFSNEQCLQTVNQLSGGQQNLLLIAKAQLSEPDLLLLDEPGNHMDILAMAQLEQYLANECRCAFMIISHDKHLLNNACDRTLFLRDKRCQKFELPFDQASALLLEQDEQAQQRLNDEQKEIDRLQSSAKRLAIIGRENDNAKLAKKAKSMQKKVGKLESDKTQLAEQSKLNLRLDNNSLDNTIHAKQLVEINGLSLYKGNQPKAENLLFEIDQLIIKPGDRIALLGINGVGKTTAVQAIKQAYVDQLNESFDVNQSIRFNPRTSLGFYDQELSLLESPLSRIDWLRDHTQANEAQIKQALIRSGIAYSEFDRPVNQLSGGEKSRMMFLSLALNNANFMILDEPTNHIDLAGKAQLTEQLINSQATLLITSHDRDFLDQIANRYLLINDGQLQALNHSDIFYQQLIDNSSASSSETKQVAVKEEVTTDLLDQAQLLERIEYLENKVELEKQQNKKRQKALLLKQWQDELALLWQQIE